MKIAISFAVASAICLAAPQLAWAWGATGHHMISSLAIEHLPDDLPAFLRTQDMPFTVGELGREPDRSKGSGKTHDAELNPGHYLDLDDDGKVLGGPSLSDLPETREGYDTRLRKVGQTQYSTGYLPYTIVGGWQQLRKDFGYWRALVAAEDNASDSSQKARFSRDRNVREMLIVHDLGIWSHYVADGSQPLHVSIHYNGWGDFPNPNNYSTDKGLHARFEGAFVQANISRDEVEALIPSPGSSSQVPIEANVSSYLSETNAHLIPLYEAEAQHEFDGPNDQGEKFVAARMAAGVGELRDLIVKAWQDSGNVGLGWPETTVGKVKAGQDPTSSIFGLD